MTAWMFVTRWGNALLLLPAASWISLRLWAGGERALARRWTMAFGGAVLLVFATKVAFLGWGIGSRALDFTGISGHSMLAASVLPMFAWWLVQDRDDATRRRVIAGSALFAIAVGLSRVLLSAHSASEVVAGLALGLAIAGVSIPRRRVAGDHVRLRWLVLFLMGFGSLSSIGDADDAHGLVVRLALAWSGRDAPFTRDML
jgi:membrane-associated phospholipid phosphatase